MFEGIVFDVDILQDLAHSGDHPGELLKVTHLLDLLNLLEEVVEVELILGQFLLQLPCLFFVVLLLGPFHEGDDVTHSEDTVGKPTGIESVDGIHLLTHPHKLDRFVDYGTNGKRCSTAGITVQLGQYHAVKVQSIIELLRRIDGILSRHRVDDEQYFLRVDSILDRFDLLHHQLVDCQSTGGIDDDHIVAL